MAGATAAPGITNHDMELPPATRWRNANEIMCGVEGIDWVDRDVDGRPDTCDGGLYAGEPLAIEGHVHLETHDAPVFLAATQRSGRLTITGSNWEPAPGSTLRVRYGSGATAAARAFDPRDASNEPA